MVDPNQHNPLNRQLSTANTAETSRASAASSSHPRHSSPQQQHQQLQPQTSGYSQFQPPPQYPAAFAPRTTQNAPQSQAQFHYHQPTPPRSTNVTTTRHQITAPFQIPRLPHPWPYPGAHRGELTGGAAGGSWSGHGTATISETGSGNVPIDPRLLGHSKGTEESHPHRPRAGGRGGQGGWPPGSGG